MAARSNVVINDGLATPVAHTFNPASIVDDKALNLATYEDRVTGIAVGYPLITLSMKRPSKASRNYRVVAKVSVPTLEVISNSTVSGILPAPQKAYDTFVTMEFVMHERAPLQSRKDILAYAKNLLAHAIITSAVQDTEMPW